MNYRLIHYLVICVKYISQKGGMIEVTSTFYILVVKMNLSMIDRHIKLLIGTRNH